jgi:hypothetical protein
MRGSSFSSYSLSRECAAIIRRALAAAGVRRELMSKLSNVGSAFATIVIIAVATATPALATFTERPEFGLRTTLSVAIGDADGDGDLDVAIGNNGGGNALYTNDGTGTFTGADHFGANGTFPIVFVDTDNDGDSDVAVGNVGGLGQNYLYVNNGNGTFTETQAFARRNTTSLAWADYDLDGDLDVAVGNGLLGVPEQNRLFINNGDGTFTGTNQFGLWQTGSMAWGDFDNDGDPDLALGAGGFCCQGQNYLYVNNGDGTFTERAEFGLKDTACMSWGDADNDGDLDMAVGNWDADGCALYVNNGDGTFTEQAQFGGRDTNTLAWGDFDNDGDLDVAVGNGDFQSAEQNYLYVNNGDGTFTEQAEFGLGSTDGVAWGDLDGDGDLDLVAGNEHSSQQNYLYVNEENDQDWLSLRLVGHGYDLGAGYSNRDAIGAKVSVYEAGFLGDPARLLGYREIEAHGGFSSQNQRAAHFGLPGQATVDVRIAWPGSAGSRIVQDLPGIAVGQPIVIDEAESATDVGGGAPQIGPGGSITITPNPMRHTADFRLAFPRTVAALEQSTATPRIEIYDSSGRRVRVLATDREGSAASFRAPWNGADDEGRVMSSGVYFARAAASARSTRFVLLR